LEDLPAACRARVAAGGRRPFSVQLKPDTRHFEKKVLKKVIR